MTYATASPSGATVLHDVSSADTKKPTASDFDNLFPYGTPSNCGRRGMRFRSVQWPRRRMHFRRCRSGAARPTESAHK